MPDQVGHDGVGSDRTEGMTVGQNKVESGKTVRAGQLGRTWDRTWDRTWGVREEKKNGADRLVSSVV